MATILSAHGVHLNVYEIKSLTGSVQKLFPLTTPPAVHVHIKVVYAHGTKLLDAHGTKLLDAH